MTLDEQYEFFLKNHYCIFPSALSPQEVIDINKAIDRSLERDGWGGPGPRASFAQPLLSSTDFDGLARHKSFFPLASKIFDGDIAIIEFCLMTRPGNQEAPTKPTGWHQDFGICEHDPLGITALSAVMCLTDIDKTTARYTLLPNSQKGDKPPQPVAEGSQDVIGEVEVVGPAGTIVLVNSGIFHTGKPGTGPRERRTIHTYMQRTNFPSVSNHSIIPRRLWDVADPEQRKFYSHFNEVTRKAIEAENAAK